MNEFSSLRRPARNFTFGQEQGHKLSGLIPSHLCATAAATCRIQIMGRDRHNYEDDAVTRSGNFMPQRSMRWVHTRMQCIGFTPRGFRRCSRDWVEADSFAAAQSIIECFDIDIRDIAEQVGRGDRLVVDLPELVEQLVAV